MHKTVITPVSVMCPDTGSEAHYPLTVDDASAIIAAWELLDEIADDHLGKQDQAILDALCTFVKSA